MRIKEVINNKLKNDFFQISSKIYKKDKSYFNSNETFNYLFYDKRTQYDKKFTKKNFLILDEPNENVIKIIGRFTIFIDRKLPKTILIGFFEFTLENQNPIPYIIEYIKILYGKNKRILFGINGSFFYGSGFLIDNYAPSHIFGDIYTKGYYNIFFKELSKISLQTYKLHISTFKQTDKDFVLIFKKKNIKFVYFSRREFTRQINIVTTVTNNAYKSSIINRTVAAKWDMDFFSKLKPLIPKENIIIIEQNGKYMGALVFIYNINEVLTNKQNINRFTVGKYNMTKQWKSAKIIRFAVNMHCKNPFLIIDGLLSKAFSIMQKKKVEFCEIGPFFESDETYTQAIKSYMCKIDSKNTRPNKTYNIYEYNT